MASQFLAVDWGTTNLRAWVVDADGSVVRREEFALGVGRLAEGEAALRFLDTVRPKMGAEALPTLLCGMIGSNIGWVQAPYLECPADIGQLRANLRRVDAPGAPIWIVPGLRGVRPDGGPDVMRGEETHVLGWAAAEPSRQRGEHLICHPGTHAKWVRLADGRIEQFVTSMTGELFDILRKHSVLQVRDAEDDEAAFDAGVEAAGDGAALASRLFTARARVVGGDMQPAHVKSYLSGLLIGAEIASTPALLGVGAETPVAVIGDMQLAGRYLRVLLAKGYVASIHDGEAAVLAGLEALLEGILVG
jgi:2-dehydro-3-deoxygalactonokinase